jgi:hypothetical protein
MTGGVREFHKQSLASSDASKLVCWLTVEKDLFGK